MTEAEWLASSDPSPMLNWLRSSGKASDRKLRLFAVACCRRIWHLLRDERSRQAVEVSELFADGLASKANLSGAYGYSWEAAWEAAAQGFDSTWDAARRAASATSSDATMAISVRQGQGDLIRDIFGNPFRPIAIDPSWLTWNDGTIPRIASGIYDNRAFDRMPILVDALEEAGCYDADILDHCRSRSGHVRGCWVLDLLLGK